MLAKWFVALGLVLLSLALLGGAVSAQEPGGQIEAVKLIGAWVDAGAPETEAFKFTGKDGKTYQATFADDILPLFTTKGLWYEGAQACSECHFAISKDSYHEMDLTTYKGILTGADAVSDPENPDKIIVPGNWNDSPLRGRLRNNRMPPGMPFVLDESNRDGPCLEVSATGVQVQKEGNKIKYGCEVNAVGLIGAWVDANAPEKEPFTYAGASLTFERDVLPLFTTKGLWYEGAQACSECHFAISKDSYHEMDLTTYKGILTGADAVSDPENPDKIIVPGNWNDSPLRGRLRNNRMPPGMPFMLDESNRDGPVVTAGKLAAETLPTTGSDGGWYAGSWSGHGGAVPVRLALVVLGSTLLLTGLALWKFGRSRRG